MKELVELVKKRFEKGGVIAFTSFVHGMGRSTVKEVIAETLRKDPELSERVVSLSTGEIFRKMALERGFEDINEFARWLRENPEEAVRVESEIDRKVRGLIREHVGKGKIVLIDSNLHAWPFALKDLPHVTFVLYVDPGTLGRRLVATKRRAERKYTSPEEAVEAQVKRTLEDSNRYLILAELVGNRELRELYRKGGLLLRRLVRAYTWWLKKRPRNLRVLTVLLGSGVHVVDNSGSIEKTVENVIKTLKQRN